MNQGVVPDLSKNKKLKTIDYRINKCLNYMLYQESKVGPVDPEFENPVEKPVMDMTEEEQLEEVYEPSFIRNYR